MALFASIFAATTGLERLRQLAEARGLRRVAWFAWGLVAVALGDLWFESRPWQEAGTGQGVVSRSHRPAPEILSAAGATARLRDFGPNELRYAIDAPEPARIVFPLRYGRDALEWELVGRDDDGGAFRRLARREGRSGHERIDAALPTAGPGDGCARECPLARCNPHPAPALASCAVRRLRDALQRPGAWFFGALVLGTAARVALVFGTEGTFDVSIKLHHGNQIERVGLLEWYRLAEVFNHPPRMGELFAAMQRVANATGIPFAVVLRAPFALLDIATASLLYLAFAGSRWRLAVCAAYWLHPLAILMSAYHGNTDSAVAFFVLAAVVAAGRGRPRLAGAALGVGLWVKLPVVLAFPALLFAMPGARARVELLAFAAGVALVGYLPALAQEPTLLVQRIAGYGGSPLETPAGAVVWGWVHTLRLDGTVVAEWASRANTLLSTAPVVALAWLRREHRGTAALGATLAASFVAFYALTSFWAWQYLAWCVPFLLFLDARVAAWLTLALGGYVYAAYAFLTGSLLLIGHWGCRRACCLARVVVGAA